jgi:glycosyltransferase involved in cell wall biosynthesis
VYRLPLRHHRGSVPLYLFDYIVFFVLAFFKLAQLSLRKRYDVVEVNTMPDFLVFVTVFVRLFGTKVILYMFENMPALFISSFRIGPSHMVVRLLRFIEKISASYAHHVIVSDGPIYRKVLESRGIPSRKITVVLNVPDDTIFNLESLPASKNGNQFRLIVVSTLVERYGVQTVVKAVPLLIKDIPELHVDIVGNGEYQPDLERMAQDLGVAPYFSFVGWTRLDTVPTYIASANIGVAPMIEDVGLPNKLFDYFALEKPTIVSALPSLIDTFHGADCVAFFQANDEKDLAARIIELYRSPEKRTSLVAHARPFYQKHRWTVMKQAYLKVYEELLS